MSILLQIDQINEPWVSVLYVNQDKPTFDLPLVLFRSLDIQPREGEVYTLTLTHNPQSQNILKTQTQSQLDYLTGDDDGEDFSL